MRIAGFAALDKPGRLREEDGFDPLRILPFLQSQISNLIDGPIELQQFEGGASKLTYLLRIGTRELILRRRPITTTADATHDLRREMRILTALAAHFPCPRPLAYCEDQSLIGSDFLVMEKVDGIILRRDLPAGMHCEPGQARRVSMNLFDTLAQLHSLDYQALGLADLGRPNGYVERQIEGWCERFENARTDDVPRCESLMHWLKQKMPADSQKPGLIHNDYRFDNAVLSPEDGETIIGVLDWETCTIGDPLMDLGNSLACWVQADDSVPLQKLRMQPSHLPGMLSRDEIVRRYCEHSGRQVGNFDFYYVFGLFKRAVLSQQIYRRFKSDPQKNPRFEAFGLAVEILARTAEQVADKSGL